MLFSFEAFIDACAASAQLAFGRARRFDLYVAAHLYFKLSQNLRVLIRGFLSSSNCLFINDSYCSFVLYYSSTVTQSFKFDGSFMYIWIFSFLIQTLCLATLLPKWQLHELVLFSRKSLPNTFFIAILMPGCSSDLISIGFKL